MKKAFIFILLAVCHHTCCLQAQQINQQEFNNMKAAFIKTFAKDFDIAGDTIQPDKTGVDFWLVTLKPKKEGLFIINHLFEHNENWGYQYNSREYEINVLPQGTKRWIAAPCSSFSICMGDSTVVPILMDTNIVKHFFSDTTRYTKPHIAFAAQTTAYYKRDIEEGFLKAQIQNNVPELSCMGIRVRSSVYRSLDRSAVTYSAFFKAIQEGKFNLIIGKETVPITILPQNGSFKTLSGHISTYSWEDHVGSSGGGGSSSSW